MSIHSPNPAPTRHPTPPKFLSDPAQAGRVDASTAGLFLLLLYTFYVYNLLQQPGFDWLELSTLTKSMILAGFALMVGIWRYLVSASADSWLQTDLWKKEEAQAEGEGGEMGAQVTMEEPPMKQEGQSAS